MEFYEIKNLILVPVIVLWFLALNNRKPWFLILGFELILTAIVELNSFLMSSSGVSNHSIYNIYLIFDFIAIMSLMMLMVNMKKWGFKLFLVSAPVLGLFFWELLIQKQDFVFATVTLIVSGFALALMAVIALIILNNREEKLIIYRGEFWVLSSIMLYFLCISPIFGLIEMFSLDNSHVGILYFANDILFVLRYVLLGIGLIIIYKNLRSNGR